MAVLITYKGETNIISGWAKKLDIGAALFSKKVKEIGSDGAIEFYSSSEYVRFSSKNQGSFLNENKPKILFVDDIIDIRKKMGFSQKKTAILLDISENTYQRYEAKTQTCPRVVILAMMKIFYAYKICRQKTK